MPMPLRALCQQRVTLDLPEYPDLTVVHNPSAYTPAFEARMAELMQGDLTAQLLANFLPALIHEWDLIDEDGEFGEAGCPVPITTAAMMKLPTTFLVAVSAAIAKAHRPFETTETAEPTGSFS